MNSKSTNPSTTQVSFVLIAVVLGIAMIVLQIINRLSGAITYLIALPLIIAGIGTLVYGIAGNNKTLAQNCSRVAPLALLAGVSTLVLTKLSGLLYTGIKWASVIAVAILLARFFWKLFSGGAKTA